MTPTPHHGPGRCMLYLKNLSEAQEDALWPRFPVTLSLDITCGGPSALLVEVEGMSSSEALAALKNFVATLGINADVEPTDEP